MYVQDVNDHTPEFQNVPYSLDVDEVCILFVCLFSCFYVFVVSGTMFLEQQRKQQTIFFLEFLNWNWSLCSDQWFIFFISFFSWMKWNYFEWNAETNNNFHSFRRKKKTLREKKTFRKTKQQQKKSFFYSCVSVNFLCLVSLLNNIFPPPPPTHKDSFIQRKKKKDKN